MVANGYSLERGINVGLGIFCSFLSLVQIRATSGHSGKKRIHLCGALALAFWILANIDPQGVYGYFPTVLVTIFTQYSLDAISAGLCLIIWSHFQVHYSSLNRDIPRYLKPTLLFGITWLVTISTVLHILEFYKSVVIFEVLDSLTNLIFTSLIFISDLYGYYLIRKVFQELHRAILETSTPQQLETGQRNSIVDHQDTIKRIRRFHFCISILLIIDLIDRIDAISSDVGNYNQFIVYADSNNYSVNIVMFPIFLVWALETWWAWTPIKASIEGGDENTKERQSNPPSEPSKYTPFKKANSNPSLTADEVQFNIKDTLTLTKNMSSGEIELETGIQTPSKQGSEPDLQQETTPQDYPQDSPM